MSIDLRFTPDDWSRIRREWSAWWDGDLDRPKVMVETSHQMVLPGEQVLTREFLLEKPAAEVVDFFWLQ